MRIVSICISGLFSFQLLFLSCAEAAALQCQSLLENHQSSILQKERVPTYSDFVREVELRMKSNDPVEYIDPMVTQPRNLKPGLDSYFMNMLFDEWKPEKSKINLPFTGLYRMKIDLHLNQNQYLNKIIQMLDIFYSSENYVDLLNKINLWVTTPNQAVLIYDVLVETRILEENPQLLIQLTKMNEHFQSGNLLVHDGLASFVSLSFEKESTSPDIVEYIKFGRVAEADWHKLSKEERFRQLKENLRSLKEQQWRGHRNEASYDIQPSPTRKTPEYFGTPFLEHNGFSDGRWEVNHHTYDFSVDRVFSAIAVANKIARNTTDSVHVHLVFPMKKKNPNFGLFRLWFKVISDYLFIMGFEESLHPGEYTQMSFLKSHIKANNIVSNQEDIVGWVNKMFTVGLRSGDTYKVNYESRFQKIGLELRDVTRDMKRLRMYVNQMIKQIQDQVWEKGALSQSEIDKAFAVEFDPDIDLKLLKEFLNPSFASQIYRRYPFVVLPLRQLEKQSYYNYRTQSLRRPTESETKALVAAREAYLIDLENLQKELVNFAAKGESVEDEIIDIALKMNLTDWAKRSRLSQLINPF